MAKKQTEKPKGKKFVNLWDKILAIQSESTMALKGGTNEHHQYKYAREVDILDIVKPLLTKYRVAVTQTSISHETTDKRDKIGIDFQITNVDEPIQFITERFYGTGEDKAGTVVGTPIAYTMALKYFLAKTFLLETGDDAEIEKRKKTRNEDEPVEVKFEKAKKMIEKSKDVAGLVEYDKMAQKSQTFTKEMKAEIHKLITAKVDGNENPKATTKN